MSDTPLADGDRASLPSATSPTPRTAPPTARTAAAGPSELLELIAALDAIVWEMDAGTGRVTFVSERAERILGYPVDRWYDDPTFWREVVVPPDAPDRALDARAPSAPDDDADGAGAYRARHADGRLVWLRDAVDVVRDEAGAPRLLRGVTVDVTRERTAAARARTLTDMVERITDAFFALDRDWRFTFVNRRAEPLLGRAPEELVGRDLWEAFPEAVGSTFWTEYHRAVRDGTPVTFTAFYAPLARWFEVNAYPDPDGLSVYFRDVSAQRGAREALERSRADLQLALDAGHFGTWEWDVAGGRVTWSAQEERLHGIPEGSFDGTLESYRARIHPDDRAEAGQLVEDALARRAEAHHALHRIVRPDGAVRWLDSHGRFVYDADGRPLRLVGVSADVTDRVLFRRLRERQSDMLGAVDVGIWYCDLPFDELQWNPKVKEHFWLPADARVTIGTFYARIHPEDRERTRAAIARSIADHTPYDIEYRTVAPDGHPEAGALRWVRAIGYTAYDRAGNPARFDGVTVDVTAQKRIAEALAVSEQRYEYAARATSNAIWDWDLATDHVTWSPGVRAVFGYADGVVEETAAWWYEHIHPDDRERVVHGIHAVIDGADGGHAWRDEYRFRRADGTHATVVDRGYVARDADGRSVRMIGAMEDVTAQREATATAERAHVQLEEQQLELELTNQQLQENAAELEAQAEELQATAAELEERTAELETERQRLERVLEQLPVGVMVVDTAGTVVSRNSALEVVLGHPAQRADEDAPATHGGLHDDGSPYALADYPVTRALRDGETVLRELTRYRRGDGRVVTLSISAAPVRDTTGRIELAVAAVEDVNDREAARAAAEEANRAKSQFLATMSHELRTPLNAIQGHVQLLEMELHGPLAHAQRETLGRIDRAQRHLLGLIDEILGYARLESGRVEYDLQAVDVAEVLRDILPIVEPLIVAKGLAFAAPVLEQPGAAPVRADRDKLAQVLLNLLSNAVKFTPAGGRVTVELTGPTAAGGAAGRADVAFLRVRDTGVGIPPDKLDAVFEPFVQVRNAYSPGQGGTGLGLAISRDLARGMGGDLAVESALGAGSTFTLTLPVA